MARLGKHGTELLRVVKEIEINNPESSTTWERKTRAYMSDGTILQKFDVRFKPMGYQTVGEVHSYGWKVFGKLKPEITMTAHVAKITSGSLVAPDSKWKIIAGGPAPVVISQARIMQAIEDGGNAGFCLACGAEADGCEPDARNYTCESCGAHEVYGAEECLMAC